jgi:hypothetical protein
VFRIARCWRNRCGIFCRVSLLSWETRGDIGNSSIYFLCDFSLWFRCLRSSWNVLLLFLCRPFASRGLSSICRSSLVLFRCLLKLFFSAFWSLCIALVRLDLPKKDLINANILFVYNSKRGILHADAISIKDMTPSQAVPYKDVITLGQFAIHVVCALLCAHTSQAFKLLGNTPHSIAFIFLKINPTLSD